MQRAVAVVCIGVIAAGFARPTVAATVDISEQAASAVTNLVVATMTDAGFEVITVEDLRNAATLEGNAVDNDCDDACLQEMASAMGTRWVAQGRMEKIGPLLLLSLSVFDQEKMEIAKRTRVQAKDLKELLTKVGVPAARLCDAIPANDDGTPVRVLVLPVTPPPSLVVVDEGLSTTQLSLWFATVPAGCCTTYLGSISMWSFVLPVLMATIGETEEPLDPRIAIPFLGPLLWAPSDPPGVQLWAGWQCASLLLFIAAGTCTGALARLAMKPPVLDEEENPPAPNTPLGAMTF